MPEGNASACMAAKGDRDTAIILANPEKGGWISATFRVSVPSLLLCPGCSIESSADDFSVVKSPHYDRE